MPVMPSSRRTASAAAPGTCVKPCRPEEDAGLAAATSLLAAASAARCFMYASTKPVCRTLGPATVPASRAGLLTFLASRGGGSRGSMPTAAAARLALPYNPFAADFALPKNTRDSRIILQPEKHQNVHSLEPRGIGFRAPLHSAVSRRPRSNAKSKVDWGQHPPRVCDEWR